MSKKKSTNEQNGRKWGEIFNSFIFCSFFVNKNNVVLVIPLWRAAEHN